MTSFCFVQKQIPLICSFPFFIHICNQGLTNMEGETAARTKSVEDLESEHEELEEDIRVDEQVIETTNADCADSETSQKTRMQLRDEELKALSEAIAILNKRSARDNFNVAFESAIGKKGKSFVP